MFCKPVSPDFSQLIKYQLKVNQKKYSKDHKKLLWNRTIFNINEMDIQDQQQLNILNMRSNNKSLLDLAKNTLSLLKGYNNKESLESQCHKRGIVNTLNQLKFQDLDIHNASAITSGVGIRTLLEYGPLRLTVYYLPQGEIMKLHDHPSMEVISYVIHGKIQASMYTQIKQQTYKKQISVLEHRSIAFIDGLNTESHNLHQFKAIEPTFFLDILFPDYDDNRECTFFEEAEEIDGTHIKLQHLDDYYVEFHPL